MTHYAERPYTLVGWDTARWNRQRYEWVNLEDLIFTQDDVYFLAVINVMRGGEPHGQRCDTPLVVKYGGKLYVEDGHTRIAASILQGETDIRVRLLDYDKQKPPS